MELIRYVIAIICIVLGFVALLTQRVYVDSATKETIHIDVPIFGKLRTNYPAVVFLFIALAIVLTTDTGFLGDENGDGDPETSVIAGRLIAHHEDVDWGQADISLRPLSYRSDIDAEDGTYTIDVYGVPSEVPVERDHARWLVIEHPEFETTQINLWRQRTIWEVDPSSSLISDVVGVDRLMEDIRMVGLED